MYESAILWRNLCSSATRSNKSNCSIISITAEHIFLKLLFVNLLIVLLLLIRYLLSFLDGSTMVCPPLLSISVKSALARKSEIKNTAHDIAVVAAKAVQLGVVQCPVDSNLREGCGRSKAHGSAVFGSLLRKEATTLKERAWVHFTNFLCSPFTIEDPKSAKRQWWFDCLLRFWDLRM